MHFYWCSRIVNFLERTIIIILVASYILPWHNREDYATIENAAVLEGVFEDASCTSSPLAVPAGWRLADWDADVAFVSR